MKKKELDPQELVKIDSVTDANLAWQIYNKAPLYFSLFTGQPINFRNEGRRYADKDRVYLITVMQVAYFLASYTFNCWTDWLSVDPDLLEYF